MRNSLRRLVTIVLVSVATVALSAAAYSQVAVRPVPVDPVVLAGNDVGFRMTARKGSTPVGQLVVRVDGEWREVEFAYGVKPVTR
jgi:hypothetical protein